VIMERGNSEILSATMSNLVLIDMSQFL
jgi:hypothetical protein